MPYQNVVGCLPNMLSQECQVNQMIHVFFGLGAKELITVNSLVLMTKDKILRKKDIESILFYFMLKTNKTVLRDTNKNSL